jgi:hypothetical protein
MGANVEGKTFLNVIWRENVKLRYVISGFPLKYIHVSNNSKEAVHSIASLHITALPP